jgi:hypothetical protein
MCMFCRSLFVLAFVLFLLDIVFSVLLRYTDFGYPFGIFKLFFTNSKNTCCVTVLNKRQRIPKEQSRMDNPEILVALGTQNTR